MRRLLRWAIRGLLVLAVLGVIAGVVIWFAARPPDPDAFYDPPDDLPATAGALVRSEAFEQGLPDGSEAWRILYTTTLEDGASAVSSGLVLASADRPDGERPVLAWAHGTTGVARGCAPTLAAKPFAGIPALAEVLDAGWVIVATDYVGLGTAGPHPYLISEAEGRAVLDSVLAARGLDDLHLSASTVVWGHSQGGHAALATGEIAAHYAPDVDLLGVAAISPATDLAALLAAAEDSPAGRLLTAMAVQAWSDRDPNLRFDDVIRRGARTIARDMASRCIMAPEVLVSGVEAEVLRGSILAEPLGGGGRLDDLIAENSPTAAISVPTLIGQGTADEVVAHSVTEAYARDRCADGMLIDLLTFAGHGHVSIVEPDSPITTPLITWTEARFDGDAAEAGCRTVEG